MTGHKGNSEFCFPKTFNVPRCDAKEKLNSLFPMVPVCFFLYFKARKIEQIVEEWRTNLPRFQGAFPHHVWVESLSYLEGVCEFWLMTRDTFFPPIGKRF